MFELNLWMHEQVFGILKKKKKEQVFGGQFAALLTVIRRWLC